jgi:tRNA(Ile)-lysidine synthase
MSLLERFQRELDSLRLPPVRALVAVSGGPDSVALLHLLHWTRETHHLDLIVAHFDHGIHPDSGRVAAGVEGLAACCGLGCEVGRGGLGPAAGETAARAARWAWLERTRLRLGAGLVFTAHHADDQAETVLMRALRGSGPAGLAGMASQSAVVVRPLLPFRRAEITTYLRTEGLPGWDDPANRDARHLRAWLRTEVLPGLRRRLPEVDTALVRLGRQAARDRRAWQLVLELLPGLDFRLEHEGVSVAAGVLSGYDSALAETVLLAAARRGGCRLGPRHARRVLDLAARAASGTSVPLAEGWMAEIAFGRLRVARTPRAESSTAWPVQGAEGEGQWGRWRLRWSREPAPARQARAGLVAWFAPVPLVVRGWTAGERLRPLGGTGRRLLVRCFQDARIPRGRRARWPVVAGPDGVVWVPGVSRSDAALPVPGMEAVRVDAEHA